MLRIYRNFVPGGIFDARLFMVGAPRPPAKPCFAPWVTRDLEERASDLAYLPIETRGFVSIGKVLVGAVLTFLLKDVRAETVGQIMSWDLERLKGVTQKSMEELREALRLNLAEQDLLLEFTGVTPLGNWLPAKWRRFVYEHYSTIAALSVDELLKQGMLDGHWARVLATNGITTLADLLPQGLNEILTFKGINCYAEFTELRKVLIEAWSLLATRLQAVRPRALIGDWVPEDLREAIQRDCQEISQVVVCGCLGQVQLTPKLGGVLAEKRLRKVGDLLALSTDDFLSWPGFRRGNLRQLIEALRVVVLDPSKRQITLAPPPISRQLIEQVFVSLNEKQRFIIDHYFGFSDKERLTPSELARVLRLQKSRLSQIFSKGITKINQGVPAMLLAQADMIIMDAAASLFGQKQIISITELTAELKQSQQIEEGCEKMILPLLLLLEMVFGKYFQFIEVSSGKRINRVSRFRAILPENLGLTETC